MKNALLVLGATVLIFAGIWFFTSKNKKITPEPTTQNPQTVAMCYYYSKETNRGFFDRAWLKMNIKGNTVDGEFRNLPAEKDSKVGTFSGTVGAVDPRSMGRTANVWWDSLAEGMRVKEELNIEFGDGSAVALFGEMVDRGDGVYIYKDKTKLTPSAVMWQMDCEQLDNTLVEDLNK